MGLFDGLFKSSKPKQVSSTNPFEENTVTDLNRIINSQEVGQQARSSAGSASLTGTDTQTAGLADPSVVVNLQDFLRDTPATDPNAAILQQVAEQRAAESTPTGFSTARKSVTEALNESIRAAGHNAGRFGGFGRSSSNDQIAQRAEEEAANALAQAYDTGQVARDQNLTSLLKSASDLETGRADTLANVAATAPLTTRGDSTRQEDQLTAEQAKETQIRQLLEILNEDKTTDSSGFRTSTTVLPGDPSPFNQLVGAVAAGTGAYKTFSGG